ncbi:MAG: TFIIB-type zinc ribbon-containing protein [Arcticibacter sp.]
MKCPNCQEPLVMTERSGVEIDYCPQCRGVWLDRGELDKIIDRSAQSVNDNTPPPQNQSHQIPPPQYPSHDPYKQVYKKKKRNFLDDIFDF